MVLCALYYYMHHVVLCGWTVEGVHVPHVPHTVTTTVTVACGTCCCPADMSLTLIFLSRSSVFFFCREPLAVCKDIFLLSWISTRLFQLIAPMICHTDINQFCVRMRDYSPFHAVSYIFQMYCLSFLKQWLYCVTEIYQLLSIILMIVHIKYNVSTDVKED